MRLLLVFSLVFAGCALEAEEPIFLTGRVLDASGAPRPDAPLELFAEEHSPFGVPTGEWLPLLSGRTDAEGRYTLAVPSGARRSATGSIRLLELRSDVPSEIRFFVTYDSELPDLRPWNAEVVSDGAGWRFTPRTIEPDETVVEHVLELSTAAGVAWSERLEGERFELPGIPAEDFGEASWGVVAWRMGRRETFPVRANWAVVEWLARERASVELAASPSPVPVSRGAPCVLHEEVLPSCPVTDGLLSVVPLDVWTGEIWLNSTALEVRLDQPVEVGRVVVRGLRTSGLERLVVEGASGDGAWRELGSVHVGFNPWDGSGLSMALEVTDLRESWIVAEIGEAPPVTRVRLRGEFEGREVFFGAVREVSVFARE